MSTPPRRPDEPPTPDASERAPRRRPYVKPSFVREAIFETTALACGKMNPTQRQCQLVRKQS